MAASIFIRLMERDILYVTVLWKFGKNALRHCRESTWIVRWENDKFRKSKKVIKEYINFAECGLYDTRNIIGDPMVNVYTDEEISIDVCYRYGYFEVFGLTEEEYADLGEYYLDLCEVVSS